MLNIIIDSVLMHDIKILSVVLLCIDLLSVIMLRVDVLIVIKVYKCYVCFVVMHIFWYII